MAKQPNTPARAPVKTVVDILDAKVLRGPVPEGAEEGTFGPVLGYQVEHRSVFADGDRRGTETIPHPEGREEPLNAEELKAEIVRLYTGA